MCVRSGFDLILRALRLPKGTEIIMSSVTIKDMVKIVEHYGYVPVPVDLDMKTLSCDLKVLEQSITQVTRQARVVTHQIQGIINKKNKATFPLDRVQKTGMIMFAHIWGTIVNLDGMAAIAKKYNLPLIEVQPHNAFVIRVNRMQAHPDLCATYRTVQKPSQALVTRDTPTRCAPLTRPGRNKA